MRFPIRFALWCFAHSLLKVSVAGRENVPRRGPALLVSNHVSYADGFLIGYCVKPMIRFMTWTPFFHVPAIGWILRRIKAIPVGLGGRSETVEAIARARADLAAGHIVCIFPEGSIARGDGMLPFKRGMEKIAAGLDVPIVPVHVNGLRGSVFGVESGGWAWSRTRRFRCRATISFGRHMPSWSAAAEVREAILDLEGAASQGGYRSRSVTSSVTASKAL